MKNSHAPQMTLPAHYYVDPQIFALEREQIFAQMWVYVGRAEELGRVGDYILRDVAGESILIVRAEDGSIRAYYNVCRHRGTQLCDKRSGHTRHRIQCPYHAWTWDLSGKLVAAPHMDGAPGFAREDYPLNDVQVSVWDGLLFVSLNPQASPLREQLAELPTKFRPWGMGELRLAHRLVYDVHANWKLIIQNYSECLHCPVIHPALQKLSHYLSGVNEPGGIGSTYLGGKMDLRGEVETMSLDGFRIGSPLPGLSSELQRQVHYYAVLPNLLLSLHPDYLMTHELRPSAHDRTEVICEFHFLPETIDNPSFDPSPVIEFWDLTNQQDWHVSELSQPGIASRAYRPGPYSPREDLLHAFDLWLLDRLGHATPNA